MIEKSPLKSPILKLVEFINTRWTIYDLKKKMKIFLRYNSTWNQK